MITIEKIKENIRELEKQIQNSYKNYSDLDQICTTVPVPEGDGTFRQFAKKILIEREHITDESHALILDNFGSNIAQAETNYFVKDLKLNSVRKNVNEITYEIIKDNVMEMISTGFKPDAILLPITYFHNVWKWNTPAISSGQITESVGDNLFIASDLILPIIFSNKYIPFDDAFIVTKNENIWKYRPDEKTNGRLTADFNWNYDDPENTVVLVRTIFNFHVKNPAGNRVLIPENIPSDDT